MGAVAERTVVVLSRRAGHEVCLITERYDNGGVKTHHALRWPDGRLERMPQNRARAVLESINQETLFDDD